MKSALHELIPDSGSGCVHSCPEADVPLLPLLAQPANLLRAWDKVRSNDGCPGVDRLGIRELDTQFPTLAAHISASLLDGTYQPKPLLRVEIPKPTGGTRTLGIPTVLDRVVLQATHQVLAPLWEPRFLRQSFAYRPGRSTLDAVQFLQTRITRTSWLFHLDIEKFFDRVPHPVALAAVREVTRDPAVFRLVETSLTCGALVSGCVLPTTAGIPQGSPLSPLLANAVLHALDLELDRRGAVFARYADDCLIICDTAGDAEQARTVVRTVLSRLGLALSESKTALTMAEAASFLGFGFAFDRAGSCLRRLGPTAIPDLEVALSDRLAGPDAGSEPDEILTSAIAVWRSWLGYFGAVEVPADLLEACAVVRRAIRQTIWQRWATPTRRLVGIRSRGVELSQLPADPTPTLLAAFPDSWMEAAGLDSSPASARGRRGGTDYSGRFEGPRPLRGLRASLLGGLLGTMAWRPTIRLWLQRAFRPGWFRLGLDFGHSRGSWIPRPRGIVFRFWGLQIRWKW